MLDIPPARRADEAVRARTGAPPLTTVPVPQIVSALPARPTPVGYLIPVEPGRRQLLVHQLVAMRKNVVVGSVEFAAADPARQRGAVLDDQGVGGHVIDAGLDRGVDRSQ